MAWKLAGLDDETAKRSVVDSATTLLGIVHHLAWVEVWWFQEVFAGENIEYPFDWDADADAERRSHGHHSRATRWFHGVPASLTQPVQTTTAQGRPRALRH